MRRPLRMLVMSQSSRLPVTTRAGSNQAFAALADEKSATAGTDLAVTSGCG